MHQADYENRFYAFIVDFFVNLGFTIAWSIFGFLVLFPDNFVFFAFVNSFIVLYIGLFMFYHFFFYVVFGGTTLGGFIFNVRIVDETWGRMKFVQSFVRALLMGLPPLVLINIPYMLIRRNQATVFDRIVNSTAVTVR